MRLIGTRTRIALAALLLVVLAVPFGLVTFGTAKGSPPSPTFREDVTVRDPGVLETFVARDGSRLAVRRFDARSIAATAASSASPPIVIAYHGSGSSSLSLATLANALATAGLTTFAPDMRGNGLSGTDGNVDHVGQLEEDLADLLAWIEASHPGARFVLFGYSSEGSFVLRAAGEPIGARFLQIVAGAPYLGLQDPASRPSGDGPGWATPYKGRFVGLKALNAVGFHLLDGLPVLAFAVPRDVEPTRGTRTWSYRTLENTSTTGGTSLTRPDRTWRDDVRPARGRLAVIWGAGDQVTDAVRARSEFAAAAPEVPVTVIADVDHIGLIRLPSAVSVLVRALAGTDAAAR